MRCGLSEGEDSVECKAARDARIPERENIGAALTSRAGGIGGHTDSGLCRSPGLDPGDAPRFQFGDNPVGDLFVKVRPLSGGTVACMCHRSFSATGRQQASLAALNPSRPTGLTLPLAGRYGAAVPYEGVRGDAERGSPAGEDVPLHTPPQ